MKQFLSLTLLVFVISLCFPTQNSLGHGLGIDTISDIDVAGDKISITVEIPMNFDSSKEKQITITTIDKKTKENSKNVTLLIGLSHNENLIFEDTFLARDGILSINVKNDHEKVTIKGEQDSSLGAWYGTKEKPLEIAGPVFESGGLYNFEIQIKTINEIANVIENPKKYFADVSMIDTASYNEKSLDGKTVPFQVKSYFNQPSSFEYDSKSRMVTIEMPFDWSEKQISHIPVVHVEVHFPKNFVDFLTPGYTGKVNGIDLFKSSVSVDDYSVEGERIVHFVLLADHLKYLKNEQKKLDDPLPKNIVFTLSTTDVVEFPLTAMTKNEEIQVDLSWDPIEIEPEKNTRFVLTIRDGATGETLRQSSYNFVLIQNGKEIYRTNGQAAVGGSFEDFTFSEDQTGPIIIKIENIRGTGLETEFGLVVVPEFGAITLLVLMIGLLAIIIVGKGSLVFPKFINKKF